MGPSSITPHHPLFRHPKSPPRPTSSTSFHISQRARNPSSSAAPSPRSSFVASPRLPHHMPLTTPTRHARSTLFRLLCQRMPAQTASLYSARSRIQICSNPVVSPSPRTNRQPLRLLDSTLNPPSVSHVRGSTPRMKKTMHLRPARLGPLANDISASTPSSLNA